MKNLTFVAFFILGLVPGALAQNLIIDPGFATPMDMTLTSAGSMTSGDWEWVYSGPPSADAEFNNLASSPREAEINTATGGAYLTPLVMQNGSPLSLTAGAAYTLTVTVYSSGAFGSGKGFSMDVAVGSVNVGPIFGVPTTNAPFTFAFTAPNSGPLEFETNTGGPVFFSDPDLELGTTTPEPQSVIFCSFLALGICYVERNRLKKVLFPARKN